MTIIKMTADEHRLCEEAMRGQKGAVLIDVLTDKMLLQDASTPDEALKRAGIGEVVKFLRSLHNGTDNFIQKKP